MLNIYINPKKEYALNQIYIHTYIYISFNAGSYYFRIHEVQ